MSSILELWLSQGIDGFYMKHLENLHVSDPDHIAKILHQWRKVLNKFSTNSTRKLLMVSHDSVKHLQSVMDPLTFLAIPPFIDLVDASLNLKSNRTRIGDEVAAIRKFWSQFPFPPPMVWHMGGVETMRLNNRIGASHNMAGLFLLSILPGSFSTFYGDEIGIQDSVDLTSLEVYRGGQLAPMQWTSGPQGNFTSEDSTPWLPLHPNYVTRNVESNSDKVQLFRKLASVKRSEDSLLTDYGTTRSSLMHTLAVRFSAPFEDDPLDYEWYQDDCGLVVVRIPVGDVLLLANFGTESVGFTDDAKCQDGGKASPFVKSDYLLRQIEIVLTANTSRRDREVVQDLLLEAGDAIIGRFIT